jgi:hypothetical protein
VSIFRTAFLALLISTLAAANPITPPPSWSSLAPVFQSVPDPAPLPISTGNWIYRFEEGQWTIEVVPDGSAAGSSLLHDPAERFVEPNLVPAGEPVPEPATFLVAASGLVALLALIHLRR